MNDLYGKWRTKETHSYSEEFKELFESFAKKGGSSTRTQQSFGKHFSNNYELYIYAFFLGIYSSEYIPIPEGKEKIDFRYHIHLWGNKSDPGRSDFSSIQENIFIALIAKAELDLIALDKEELSVENAVKILSQTMEAYVNGGLTLINEKLEDNSNFFLQPTAFLNLILWSKK